MSPLTPDSSSGSSPNIDYHVRRQTCLQCRTRKVRCDGVHDVCGSCKRLKFDCSFRAKPKNAAKTQDEPALERPERLRGPRACIPCRSQKSRCSGEVPVCDNCQRRKKTCHYATPKRTVKAASAGVKQHTTSNIRSEGSPSNRSSEAAVNLPEGDEFLSLLDHFFLHVYPLSVYSILHEPSTRQRWADGSLEESLALAICGTAAAKLQMSAYHPDISDVWIARAENYIWNAIETPSIFRLQALLLIVLYHVDSGRGSQRAFMLAALAARMASALRLNYERPDLSPVAQEVRRRIMWSIVRVDGLFSVGLPEYETLAFENIYLQLPCKEEIFTAGIFVQTETLKIPEHRFLDSLGPHSLSIRVSSFRRDMKRFSRQLALTDPEIPQLNSLMANFEQKLQELTAEVTSLYPYSPSALSEEMKSRWFPRYFTLHLMLPSAYCDFYRLFLRGYSEAAPDSILDSIAEETLINAAQVCQQQSMAVVELLSEYDRQCTTWRLLNYDAAINAYHTARLLLFLDRGPDRIKITSGITLFEGVQICYRFVKRFFSFPSGVTSVIVSDMERMVATHSLIEDPVSGNLLQKTCQKDTQDTSWESKAARNHRRLAIHSLIHQANFVDDSYRYESPTTPGSKPSPDQLNWSSGGISNTTGSVFADEQSLSSFLPGILEPQYGSVE